MTSLENKKVLVVGMARSGQAAARFLAALGARVTGTDIKRQSELDLDPGGMGPCFELVAGGYPELRRGKYDLLVVSPGVPLTIAPLAEAAQLGIPVWSELELASRFIREPIIAITGTNGKTTTTALAGYIFEKAGRRVVVAGNIGIPLIGEVERTLRERSGVDYWIVEVSSFQLERSHNFRPHIAVLLNLTPDHLDRHRTLEEYGRVKARLFQNQDSGDHAVLNLEDPWVNSRVEKLRAEKCWFSTKRVPATGIGIEEGTIAYTADGLREDLCEARSILIPGPHNLANALAASATALLAGIGRETIAAALSTFPGVPHRLEPAGIVGGVRYVNDSKGTNPDSVLKALDSYSEPIILIAGGKAKGSDFSALAERIKLRVKALVLLGQAAPQIEEAVRAAGYNAVWRAATLEESVQTAARLASPGDVVLLSPACASWDMFRDYEERGDLFKSLVCQMSEDAPPAGYRAHPQDGRPAGGVRYPL